MASTAAVKKQRVEFDGRLYFKEFRDYCGLTNIEATPDSLRLWDETKNDSCIRKSFGYKKDIYELGLLENYRRFLNIYCLKIDNGTPVRLSDGSTFQPKINALRVVDGHRVFLEELTSKHQVSIREALQDQVRSLLRVQKFFNLGVPEIRAAVNEVINELEN